MSEADVEQRREQSLREPASSAGQEVTSQSSVSASLTEGSAEVEAEDPWSRDDPWSMGRRDNRPWLANYEQQSGEAATSPWMTYYENWSVRSDRDGRQDSHSGSASQRSWSGSDRSSSWWHSWGEQWPARRWNADDGYWNYYDNWSVRSSWSSGTSQDSDSGELQADPRAGGAERLGDPPLHRAQGAVALQHDSGVCHANDHQPHGVPASPGSPTSPKQLKDEFGRPTGRTPGGEPSIAGGSGCSDGKKQAEFAMSGKLSSSYPPIFYARPGESWLDYWRTVEFWLASEGRTLPPEVRGPRLMQQLRERAAKIVQRLTVGEVSAEDGIHVIRRTMEASPIIKILDTKKVDKRRQKFMRLSRLPGESIESFLNRAEIYRRENQTSPDYTVGSKFYIGHLLDAAKLTKRDLALLKAAAGGTLEEEDAVIVALLELADQLEGLPHCAIGKGETTLDNEDRFLVQKGGGGDPVNYPSKADNTSSAFARFHRAKKRGFNRRRAREALVAIMEDEEPDPVGLQEAEELFGPLDGEDSADDDESVEMESPNATLVSSSNGTSKDDQPQQPEGPLMEIYAQEYKARNKVRELKKMRQYFQRDKGGPQSEHVQKWVKEQQKTDPCFLCGKLGHWSQECPLRRRPPVHASNVTFPHGGTDCHEWDLLETLAQQSDLNQRAYMVHVSTGGEHEHEVYWTMKELGNQMIVDLGCMRTVAGTTWVNQLVQCLKSQGRFIQVLREKEAFRFGRSGPGYGTLCSAHLRGSWKLSSPSQ